MINRELFIKFLNYIGITNERHHAKIHKQYVKFYNKSINPSARNLQNVNSNYKKYRMSNYRSFLINLGYDEGMQDNIINYLIKPEFREKIHKEILKYSGYGIWGKEFKNEVVFQNEESNNRRIQYSFKV